MSHTWDSAHRKARFFALTKRDAGGPKTNGIECLEWQGNTGRKGYGRFYCPGFPSVTGMPRRSSTILAHRYALAIYMGHTLTPELHADHRCCNKACVEALHLMELGAAENTARGNVTRHLPRAESIDDLF